MSEIPDHVLRNRSAWDQWAPDYAAAGLRGWEAADPTFEWARRWPCEEVWKARKLR